ncbi:MAG: ATP-binding cassette domain-containing protein [Desulfopila sp.]
MPILYELSDVRRTFKGRTILHIPRLAIEAGRIYTLIGPNGAGKTTLLHLLAFLDAPTSGEIRFAGARLDSTAAALLAARRRVVLLDQYPILFTGPVWKNVEYGLKIRGVGVAERRRRVDEMLELVGMRQFVKAEAHKLSGGETKRVALARALATRPEVLLCDEPGANVDKENQEIILAILDRVNSEENTSIIFSTHYLAQGRSLADHSLMLEHGTLTDVVPENVYRLQVLRHERNRLLCQVAGRLLLSMPEDLVAEEGGNLKLQIDPERVVIVAGDVGAGRLNTFSGHVQSIGQDRGRVRIGVDIGIKLSFFLSMQQYLANPPLLGSRLLVHFPDHGLRCSASR